jgi:deoxyribodipyrimidine photo-lyase
LHFGQISAQRIALALNDFENDESVASFLEELIIRRELSDNFCYYNLITTILKDFTNGQKRP